MLESNLKRVIGHIGDGLSAKRIEAGLSLKDVAEKLHIQPIYLDAIERLDQDTLPALGYALGYVRTYARFLGMNERNAIERFKVDIEAPRNLSAPLEPHFIPKRSLHFPKGSIAIGGLLSCVFVVVSWYGMQSDALSATPEILTIQQDKNWGFAAAEPSKDNANMISLKAIGPSWVQVKDLDGNVLISRIMVLGEIFETERKNLPILSLRDAGAIELYIGGKLVGAIGQRGETARNIALAEVSRY